MDLTFILNGITFIWNEEKAKQNPFKHKGITFEETIINNALAEISR